MQSAAPNESARPMVPNGNEPRGEAAAARPAAKETKRDWFIPTIVFALLAMAAFLFFLFSRLTANYEKNVTAESSEHLAEINYQIKQSVQDRVENDWLITYTVAACITESNFVDDDAAVFRLMERLKALWQVSDITLYTENGDNVSVSGDTAANDLASDRIDKARKNGEYMTIIESNITYTIPVDTALTFRGSRVVAVSLVKSMASFLDDMGFSSFGDAAYMYLADDNGKVISRLTNPAAAATYNITTLLSDTLRSAATEEHVAVRDVLKANTPTVYLQNGDYVVISSVMTRRRPLLLLYFVPESAVNRTVSSYSKSVTTTSLTILTVFAACAALLIWYLNKVRKKQFDSAILTRERMFDLLVQNSSTSFGLFEVDQPQPVFLSANSEAVTGVGGVSLCRAETGYVLRNAEGKAEDAFREVNDSLRAWDGTSVFRSGYMLNSASVSHDYYQISLTPVNNEAEMYVGIAQDVTLLREREDEVQDALSLAKRANEAKSRFLSNMSHDIRTPMNAIVNMADFAIEDMANPEKLREHLSEIRESSDHLLMLINDVLDMSRIESGNTVVANQPFDLLSELHRLKSIITPLCEAKELTLLTDFGGVPAGNLAGDQVKVSQVLMNLLSNAVKFTPKRGAVRFTVSEEAQAREGFVTLRFVVEDTGMGISPNFLPHIFEPFSREDASRITGIQGTGLGLSICKSYVNAMGGTIECTSEEGDGSVFTVVLTFEKSDAVQRQKPEATAWDIKPFAGSRCLLCEDHPINRRIAKTILERLGFKVDTAADGREGVVMFEASRPNYYDVVYMDIQMPIMDGYEAAVAIRSCGHPQAKTIPIIAMTANVFAEDVEKAHIAGMDGHIGKPIVIADLSNETSMVLSKKRRMTT